MLFAGRNSSQIKAEAQKKGDLGQVAEVGQRCLHFIGR